MIQVECMKNMILRYCPRVQSAHFRRKRGRSLGCLVKLQLHWKPEVVWVLCLGPREDFLWRASGPGPQLVCAVVGAASSSVFRTQDVVWTCRWRTSAWAFRLRNSSWMKSVNVFLISIWGKQEQNKLLKHLPDIYVRKMTLAFESG